MINERNPCEFFPRTPSVSIETADDVCPSDLLTLDVANANVC